MVLYDDAEHSAGSVTNVLSEYYDTNEVFFYPADP